MQNGQSRIHRTSPDTSSKNGNIVAVLRIRAFLFLWGSQILSQIAFNLLSFGLAIRVYELTGRNIDVSLLVLSFLVPQLILSLFAGVFVDRFEKKLVLLISNALRAVFLLPLLILPENLFAIYVSSLAISTATQFFVPAEAPMIPKIVPKNLLLFANSLFTVTLFGSIFVGYIIAGPALKYGGIQPTLLVMAVLFVAASIFNSLLPGAGGADFFKHDIPKLYQITYGKITRILFNDIGEMLFYVIASSKIRSAVVFLTISQAVITILGAILPGYAVTVLAIDVKDSSLVILAPAVIGMIVGSLLVSYIGARIDKNRLVAPGVLLSGVMFLLLPVFSRAASPGVFFSVYAFLPFHIIVLVILTCFLLGVFNAFVVVPSNTIIQESSDTAIRGRIYGFFATLSALFSLVPVFLAGYFSDTFGVGRVLTFIGSAIIVLGILDFFRRGTK